MQIVCNTSQLVSFFCTLLFMFSSVMHQVPFPEVFSRQMMVQLKNLAQVFRVSVSLFSHAKEGRNYITVTGTPEKMVKKSLELVNRWVSCSMKVFCGLLSLY